MKICAACNKDLPKDSYSKKQWKLDECQRRCKVCITNNREIQSLPKKRVSVDLPGTKAIIKSLDSMCLGIVEKEISDEDLFKQPPPPEEDCPICFLQLPLLNSTGKKYYSCCGKVICSGCAHAPVYDNQGNIIAKKTCPFCRVPLIPKSRKELVERRKRRIEAGDAIAIFGLGCDYQAGTCGFPQDYTKALELWHRAGELGFASAYHNIGNAYYYGRGVEVDKKKARNYTELAAMRGNVSARHNLGVNEASAGNMKRAINHYIIAVKGGNNGSLKLIKKLYSKGDATKDDYTEALRAYQTYLSEIKSDARDKAAAYSDKFRYY